MGPALPFGTSRTADAGGRRGDRTARHPAGVRSARNVRARRHDQPAAGGERPRRVDAAGRRPGARPRVGAPAAARAALRAGRARRDGARRLSRLRHRLRGAVRPIAGRARRAGTRAGAHPLQRRQGPHRVRGGDRAARARRPTRDDRRGLSAHQSPDALDDATPHLARVPRVALAHAAARDAGASRGTRAVPRGRLHDHGGAARLDRRLPP